MNFVILQSDTRRVKFGHAPPPPLSPVSAAANLAYRQQEILIAKRSSIAQFTQLHHLRAHQYASSTLLYPQKSQIQMPPEPVQMGEDPSLHPTVQDHQVSPLVAIIATCCLLPFGNGGQSWLPYTDFITCLFDLSTNTFYNASFYNLLGFTCLCRFISKLSLPIC